MSYYPPIPEGTAFALELIERRLKEDPDYLQDAPYTDEEVLLLSRLLLTEEGTTLDQEGEAQETGDKWDRLERESNSLFRSLTELNQSLDSRDHTEKMQYFRTATQLLDKIVGIQERATNLRQIADFHATVMSVMDEVLEPGQRTEVMERLKKSQSDR